MGSGQFRFGRFTNFDAEWVTQLLDEGYLVEDPSDRISLQIPFDGQIAREQIFRA